VTAAQGQEARFLFEPVPLADAKPASAPQSTTMQVSGSIRGRARSDGTIEVAVDTWRGFQRDGAGVGAGSRKRLTARLGETIDLALPVELYRDASGAAAPHATAIRLTARRVW
jgi:hypothetical protein